MGNFLNTAWGSYVKAFIAILLAYVINSGSVFNINWKELIGAAALSFIPMLIKAISGVTGGFFNTVYGGYVKTLLVVSLAFVVQSGSIYGLDWHAMINAAVMALATVIVNAVNPGDTRYGIGKNN